MSRTRTAVRSRRSLRSLSALTLVVAVTGLAAWSAGCTEKLVEPPPPEPVFGVPDSIQEVFTNHCAFVGCHGGATPQQGMGLNDARQSWLSIVGVPALELGGTFLRIAPGDSANSYMVMKLRDDARIQNQPMPLGSFPLDSALVMRIAIWAQAGAPGQEQPVARRALAVTR